MDAYISTAWTVVKFVLATIVYVYAVSFVALFFVMLLEFIRFLRGNKDRNFPNNSAEESTEDTRRGE